jgi:hypothetical protein
MFVNRLAGRRGASLHGSARQVQVFGAMDKLYNNCAWNGNFTTVYDGVMTNAAPFRESL